MRQHKEAIKGVMQVINGAGPLKFVLWGTVFAIAVTIVLSIAIPLFTVLFGLFSW